MKKIALLLSLFCLSLMNMQAESADNIWRSITDWTKYCPHGEFGDITEYALYDVDGDGINECFVKGSYEAYGILCCGNGKGGADKSKINLAGNSIYTTYLIIVKDKPFVAHQGGCGTGCHVCDYYKFEKSCHTASYMCLTTYGPDDGEDGKSEYSFWKPGQEGERTIPSSTFDKNTPKEYDHLRMDEIKWIEVGGNSSLSAPTAKNEASVVYESRDTLIIKDKKGYYYAVLNNGNLAVAPGGNYNGDIVIPEMVYFNGQNRFVTTVRRGAFYKKEDATNIGNITSISLPESVQLIGSDAFRGNKSLTKVTYSPTARIETRSFFGCPNLKLEAIEPTFAFTQPGLCDKENINNIYLPLQEKDANVEKYRWAFFKYNHNSIVYNRWNNQSEEAMECYCSNPKYIRGALYNFQDPTCIDNMFKGYLNKEYYSFTLMLADNGFVGTHDFLMYSRWVWGEDQISAPKAFRQLMETKYGRKAKYCCECAKLLYSTNEQLIITEFEITNHEAMYVLSWIKDGKEVCSYECKQKTDPEYEDFSVWNVDDDGSYGIPNVLNIARDEKGNIELFILHSAPESMNFSHYKQQGKKLVEVSHEQWYVWVDCPYEE